MYSLLPVCLGSSAATEFFQTSTNTPSWFHCSCLWRTELERIYCDNKNLDRCVRLFSLIFDLNLFSFSLLLSLSTPYGEKFISCLFSSSFNISESLYQTSPMSLDLITLTLSSFPCCSLGAAFLDRSSFLWCSSRLFPINQHQSCDALAGTHFSNCGLLGTFVHFIGKLHEFNSFSC